MFERAGRAGAEGDVDRADTTARGRRIDVGNLTYSTSVPVFKELHVFIVVAESKLTPLVNNRLYLLRISGRS